MLPMNRQPVNPNSVGYNPTTNMASPMITRRVSSPLKRFVTKDIQYYASPEYFKKITNELSTIQPGTNEYVIKQIEHPYILGRGGPIQAILNEIDIAMLTLSPKNTSSQNELRQIMINAPGLNVEGIISILNGLKTCLPQPNYSGPSKLYPNRYYYAYRLLRQLRNFLIVFYSQEDIAQGYHMTENGQMYKLPISHLDSATPISNMNKLNYNQMQNVNYINYDWLQMMTEITNAICQPVQPGAGRKKRTVKKRSTKKKTTKKH